MLLLPTSSACAENLDRDTVQRFDEYWRVGGRAEEVLPEALDVFNSHFAIFPWEQLRADAAGFDVGCGNGRWARFVAERVGVLYCIDASAAALSQARRLLQGISNCTFVRGSVEALPLRDSSMDFGYAIGLLHYVPDPGAALRACVSKLKKGAPFLVYAYYALDNRPPWYRLLWRQVDLVRLAIAHAPFWVRYIVSQAVAVGVYFPLARVARLMESHGIDVGQIPLSAYRNRSFRTMRLDALNRFNQRLEHRFTRTRLQELMAAAGLERITFSTLPAYWRAVGYRG